MRGIERFCWIFAGEREETELNFPAEETVGSRSWCWVAQDKTFLLSSDRVLRSGPHSSSLSFDLGTITYSLHSLGFSALSVYFVALSGDPFIWVFIIGINF